VIEAKGRKREVEQFPRAAPGLSRVVHVLVLDHQQSSLGQVREEVGDKCNATLALEEERVLGRPAARRKERTETARELITLGIANIGLLFDLSCRGRRMDRNAERSAVSPRRALMYAGREANGDRVTEAGELLRFERERIDEHDTFGVGHCVRCAEEVDPVVVDAPRPDARHDFMGLRRDGIWLAHRVMVGDMQHLAHWGDVKPRRREEGHIASIWRDLGTAVGTVGVGVTRIDIDPGKWSTAAHTELAEEEIFFVLGGSGISWQDGQTYEVGEGDCLVHLAAQEAHTLRAGADGLEVLAFGMRIYATGTLLPRAGLVWMNDSFVDVTPDSRHPWEREAAAGEPETGAPAERPANIVNVSDAKRYESSHIDDRDLGPKSERTGLCQVVLEPGKEGYPPHCHSADEEIFVILDGSGTLYLGDEEAVVRAGHVLSRPPGTGIAHSFRAGDHGMRYLAYGTREPNDIAYYPRSNKVNFRGIKLIGRIERLDYWDGEPPED